MVLDTSTLAERVREAIHASGMTQQSVAEAAGLDPTALSKALAAKRQFKTLELALIADAVGVPVSQLLADEAQATGPASVAARVQPGSSPAAADACEHVGEMLDLDELLCELGFESKQEPKRFRLSGGTPHEEGERLARQARAEIGAGKAELPPDIDDLASYLEDALGVDVAVQPLTPGLDGLAATRGRFGLIMVSSSVHATRQRYTLAHELGHVLAEDGRLLHIDENVLGAKTPEEERANAFAAAFLMPADALWTAVAGQKGTPSEEFIAQMLGQYRVSLDALAFRLHNVGIVKADGRDRIRRMSSVRISLRQGRAADLQARGERRWPGCLLARAVEAYAKGRLSIRPIASLLQVDPDALLEELAPPVASAELAAAEAVPVL